MPLLRPAVNDDDSPISKIVKYIPAEIIAVYTAIVGVLKPAANSIPVNIDIQRYFYIVLFLIVVTPVWTYIAVKSNNNITEPPSKNKRAIFHAIIATVSFMIWIYALGDILFRTWLCHKCLYLPTSTDQAKNFKDFTDCLNSCNSYDSKLGSIILILFTVILVPLLEYFILQKPIPPTFSKFKLDSQAQEIINECERDFDTYKSDCSGFVKAVANKFNVDLTGQADAIVNQVQGSPWTKITNGVDAKAKADVGWLVIAGLKGGDHTPPRANGHVVIIVSGPLANGKYPTGYWGTLGGVGRKNITINYAWRDVDRDNIVYSGMIV